MKERYISEEDILEFKQNLIEEEKSILTVQKYIHDISAFNSHFSEEIITKEKVISYKQKLIIDGYAVRSISPMVEKIEVVRYGKVRRAKLFYLRERTGKSARVKEKIR